MLHCFDPIRDMTFWAILAGSIDGYTVFDDESCIRFLQFTVY